MGAERGYTVMALDRPGYGEFGARTPTRWRLPTNASPLAYGAVDKILGDRTRGAGLFLLAPLRRM